MSFLKVVFESQLVKIFLKKKNMHSLTLHSVYSALSSKKKT